MTYSSEKVRLVGDLLSQGLPHAEISRRTGVSRYSISQWSELGPDELAARRESLEQGVPHDRSSCGIRQHLPGPQYAYLLGLYLGDGCVSAGHRGVHVLRIVLDAAYPMILEEAAEAMAAVLPNVVGRTALPGCFEVHSSSKHWPCLFPQHGPGRKHLRRIELEPWQREIAIGRHPQKLLRGLIHSDGSRFLNRVKGRPYPRYMFANNSEDLHSIFCQACDALGVEHRRASWKNTSVARRQSVARLDQFVGPKR